MNLLPLFFVSGVAVGLETALTRYFAVAGWSDYGYWVISIVMAGFAFSGVTLALMRAALLQRADGLLAVLPGLLVVSAALGYAFTILNPFNPLQLQNPVTYLPQLVNIALYYAALLPFFFLAGLFISLCFVMYKERISRVYAADLLGAGAGTMILLALMYRLGPFALVPALLPGLALAAVFTQRFRLKASLGAVAALVAAEVLLLLGPHASISQYKPLYPPLHTPGARVLAVRNAPRGNYLLLDDFTERVNTDISNDAGMMGYADPPRSFGLYRDGIRIASLPMPGVAGTGYAEGALDAAPYQLVVHPHVLLAGASGGFRIAEVLALGAAWVTAAEPEPVLYAAVVHGMGVSPGFAGDKRVRIEAVGPRVALRDGPFDVIDLSGDFMDAAPANVNSFTAEAMAAYMRALTPQGMISIPVSIQDLPVYALRMLATVRAALALDGVADPLAHVVVYRSAWNARILVGRAPFSASRINIIRKWCDDRSFDVSYYDNMDVAAARADLYNDLPAVSFDAGTVTSYGPDDSIADEAQAVLKASPSVSGAAFNLTPVTDDRPGFYAVLRLNDLSVLLARLQILPQSEIGALVNIAVLAQAAIIAALVMAAPLLAPRVTEGRSGLLRSALYFPALAIGFLFVEIFAIEKASAFLDDRATGFALVLSFMLIFSGLGSLLSGRFTARPRPAMRVAALLIGLWSLGMLMALPELMLAGQGLGFALRAALVVLAIAPVSVVLGLPFPLGLSAVREGSFLPWAWGLNGAFSVVATPLAALTGRIYGFHAVLAVAVLMYMLAATTFPASRRQHAWFTRSTPSPVAD